MPSIFRTLRSTYPTQFWLMMVGMLISTIGSSMIWPFMMVYVSEQLDLPLTAVASLMTVNAVMGLIFSFLAGPLVDRLGRKWAMVISLAANGIAYAFMSNAHTLPVFAILMGAQGAFNPLYRVGSDAMMADLIPPERRADGYSLLRMSNNLGIALGPAIGGFLASVSYDYAFYGATIGLTTYSLLIAFFARETLSAQMVNSAISQVRERFGGYGRILKDSAYRHFLLSFTLNSICAMMIWTLLPVYTKQNFGIPENQYGFIPATNAIMVVTLQFAVTRIAKRYVPQSVMTVGTALYALAVLSVAFGQGFWWFWVSMVIMTLGELTLVPTATTYVANIAPPDMRGRYMSLYGLCWSVAHGIGPLYGGFLNDNFGPVTIWYGSAVVGMFSIILFMSLSRRNQVTHASA